MTSDRWAGERARWRNRITHTTIVLVDSHTEPVWLDQDGGRWVTVCDDHGNVINHPTYDLARDHLAAPWGWCDPCQKLLDAYNAKQRQRPESKPR